MQEIPTREDQKKEARKFLALALRNVADEVERDGPMDNIDRAVSELKAGIENYIREERAAEETGAPSA